MDTSAFNNQLELCRCLDHDKKMIKCMLDGSASSPDTHSLHRSCKASQNRACVHERQHVCLLSINDRKAKSRVIIQSPVCSYCIVLALLDTKGPKSPVSSPHMLCRLSLYATEISRSHR